METIQYSEDARHYISLIHNTINRMAGNSANCKAWLIALITACLTFSHGVLLSNFWILLFPSFLFFFLDCYYLGLERRFIKIETQFLNNLRQNENVSNMLYSFNIRPLGSNIKWTSKAMLSWSTMPFYSLIIIIILIIYGKKRNTDDIIAIFLKEFVFIKVSFMLSIKYFRAYSEEGKQLENILNESLVSFLRNELNVESTFESYDSKGLSHKNGNAPWKVLSFALSNAIVIIDGSIEEVDNYKLGANYECITPAVSSLDNVLVVSRTQLPLNFIACRSNVPLLGEPDKIKRNNRGGYTKSYNNNEILTWLCSELKKMYYNVNENDENTNRLIRPDNLKIDLANSTLSDLMQREKDVMEENIAARRRESHFKDKDDNEREKKKIFISYRTRYYTTEDEPQKSRYGGKYNIVDVAERIKKYHNEIGDATEWDDPFYYPVGVLSNEFMPENRRWAFVSLPDRKIRECHEFWIFNTRNKLNSNGEIEEVGYWDSWWCLGEFLTVIRMKYAGQLKTNFKVMIFNPDKDNPIEELPLDQIPSMTDEQNRELARYFANGDFLETGLETMDGMRNKRKWPKVLRYVYFSFMKRFIWPMIFGDFRNYPFVYFEESIKSHVYDKSFVNNRILECNICNAKGMTMNDVLKDENYVWNFLNINSYYSDKIPGLRTYKGVINLSEQELRKYLQQDGTYEISCENHHTLKIKKSLDKFYIFWQPRNGKPTGPNKCVIETVDLYEVV